MKKQIIITLENNQVSLSTNQPVAYDEATEILGTAQLLMFNQTHKQNPTPGFKQHLFDLYNRTASNILDEMIPDNIHPSISAQAILKAENELLDLPSATKH
jgi:hypothetical protein